MFIGNVPHWQKGRIESTIIPRAIGHQVGAILTDVAAARHLLMTRLLYRYGTVVDCIHNLEPAL